MQIAILDSGILRGTLITGKIVEDLVVGDYGHIRKRNARDSIQSFHGTLVAAILHKYYTDDEVVCLDIFNGANTATCRALAAAMRWCAKEGMPIINISAGTTVARDFPRISRAAVALIRNGQVLVAAYNPKGLLSFPAAQAGVLGVKTDATLRNNQYKQDRTAGKTDYIASSIHELPKCDGTFLHTPPSTSYAAPVIAAAVASAMDESCFQL